MAMRDTWIESREAAQASANGNRNMSQMHFARKGVITEDSIILLHWQHIQVACTSVH